MVTGYRCTNLGLLNHHRQSMFRGQQNLVTNFSMDVLLAQQKLSNLYISYIQNIQNIYSFISHVSQTFHSLSNMK